MDILAAFIIGAFGGAVAVLFIVGASVVKRENNAYMEGFLAGQRDKEVKK